MATAMDESSTETLTELYSKASHLYDEVESTDLASNSDEYQEMVERCRCRFEHLTLLVSKFGVFSSNENIEELPASSIEFLCIPALLAQLTLKRRCLPPSQPRNTDAAKESRNGKAEGTPHEELLPDRQTILRLAKVYCKDFLTRCIQYGITKEELPKEITEENRMKPAAAKGGRPTPQQLHAMGCERDKKVSRYREKMSLQSKLKDLKNTLGNADEETKRDYYTSAVQHSIITSFEELESIMQESSMLEQMMVRQPHQATPTPKTSTSSSSFKPLLITRDATQKAVFGRGYPSLPIMSVDEFYEKRVREGWFPPGSSSGGAAASGLSSVVVEHGAADDAEPRADDEQNSDEEDSEEKRSKLQDRDQYRDMHRRGWGNTYNRS